MNSDDPPAWCTAETENGIRAQAGQTLDGERYFFKQFD
jgi:hypothetical protein